MNIANTILSALVLMVVANSASAINPASMDSLKPYQKFLPGAGEGYARVYKDRSKADFVAILRDPDLAKKEMRIDCGKLINQIVEARQGLPLEGCAGAASVIEADANFDVVDCDDAVLAHYLVGVTNADGSAFGSWPRTCLPGKEPILTYKGEYVTSLRCLNPLFAKDVARAPAPKPVARTLPPAETFVDVYPAAGTCSWGPRNSRYVAVHMMEPATAKHQCAVEHMLPQNGMVEVPEGTTPPVLGGPGKPTGKEFSQVCGELVHREGFAFGTEVHEDVKIYIKDATSDKQWKFFEGQQIGNRLVSSGLGAEFLAAGGLVLRIPDEYDHIDGDVYAIFSNQSKVRTPAPSGVWEKLASFKRDCDARILTGIDAVPGAPASAPATTSTGASMNGGGLAQQ